jgi:hypothetical protein
MKTARRFLLAPSLARLITREQGVDRQIIEGYLSVKPGINQFVRLQIDECHLVLPLLGPDGELTEDLAPLPRTHAEMLFALCIGQISYDQFHLLLPGVASDEALLDRIIYPSSCDVITIEFGGQEQAEGFEVPLWFGPEVTAEYSYERRYIALNGVPPNSEVPLSSQQLEAVLDMLDQAKLATETARQSAAHEVVSALSRSLETSGMLKGTGESTRPSEVPVVQQMESPMKRLMP